MCASADHLASLRALPFHVHLIEYDAAGALAGGYDDGSWTSVSDVGREFGGRVLTAAEYARVEQAHLDAPREMSTEAGVDHLTLRHHAGVSRSSSATTTTSTAATASFPKGWRSRAEGLHPRVDEGPSAWLSDDCPLLLWDAKGES